MRRRVRPLRGPALGIVVTALAGLALPAPSEALDVFLRSPRAGQAVFGRVTLEADVLSSEPVARLVFRVDGEVVAELTEPPWTTTVDVGQENRSRTFEVTVVDAAEESATARVETPPIAVAMELDLGLQQLYVTVTRRGERVLDLPREAFTVLDQGEPQELVTFEGGDVPLTAALLVDASLSMRGPRLEAALEGAGTFVREMLPLDEAALVLFCDRILHRTEFTGDPDVVAQALDRVEAQGGTALNDALYAALNLLDRRQGRRVVILLSDGVDIESVLSVEDVRWKAERSQATIYWIRLQDPDAPPVVARTSAWRGSEGHGSERAGLAELVARSGGRVVELARIEEAPQAFGEILSELRDQYVLGYYPSLDLDDGSWHRVRVEVDGFGLAVRTREGYVDD
ncbi:MAG: VWA domain-containing protein [Thermoanaerobaculia bacterium]